MTTEENKIQVSKKKSAKTTQYYSLQNILSCKAHYNVVFGERSNGKTFACLERGIKKAFTGKGTMAILRRWDTDISNFNCREMFAGINEGGFVPQWTNGVYQQIVYKNSCWYFAKVNSKKEVIPEKEPIAHAFALTEVEHYKSISFPNVSTIIFDEFIAMGAYLPDEFKIFTNMLSTIIRDRTGVEIFMCGNTVNRYCPYFKNMGLTHVKDQKPGEIHTYKFGEDGLKIAVEYTLPNVKGKKSDVYFAFDDPKVKMITNGEWELDVYPGLPESYNREQIVFTYFIVFDDEIFQCEVKEGKYELFTYKHKKTTPIKKENEDLVYSTEYSNRPNYRRNLYRPISKTDKKLYEFFRKGKVFYQDNLCGDTVKNYMIWCRDEA